MKRPRWTPVVAGALLLAVLAAYVSSKLQVTSDIGHFLPEGADRDASLLSRALANSELARSMVLVVEGTSAEAAATGSRALASELKHSQGVAWVRSGIDEAEQKATYDLYFARRFNFFDDAPDAGQLPLTDEAMLAAARALRAALASPMGPLVRRIAAADPLLLFFAHMERLRSSQDASIHVEGEQLMSADGRHGILFLGLHAAPLDTERQTEAMTSIDAAFARVNASMGGVLRLESSGINRFAVSSAKSIRSDVQRISLLSTVSVVVLFLVAFRSVRHVVLGLVPLVAGTVCAMAAACALFGEVHGLTLAFGASLIGVAIDYTSLYFTHHAVAPNPDGPEAAMDHLWAGLLLGALTTAAGLAGLAWTSFPGLREIAIFSTIGVLSALLATRCLLPPFMPRKPRPVRLLQMIAASLGRGIERLMRVRRILLVVPALGVMLFFAAGMTRARWNDDVSALSVVDPALAAEDRRVRSEVGNTEPGQFIVALGDNDEEALARNDEVSRRLARARKDGVLDGFHSLHELLWSARQQERSRAELAGDPTLPLRMQVALRTAGFVPNTFHEFFADLAGPSPGALTFRELLGSPLADIVRPFRVVIGGRVGVVTPVTGVRDGAALRARLAGLREVHYFDQRAFLEDAYGRFRKRTLQLVGVGLLVVFLIVYGRYRNLRLSLAAFLPCVLAAGATVSILALSGRVLNLMHLIGILLVLSMGADYGIFVVESRDHAEEVGATLLGVIVAMTTTVFSFGLLGMSANPALSALGVTSGLGVLLSALCAPVALVLLRSERGQR